MSLWADGFWAPGFWAPGFWAEGAAPEYGRFFPPVAEALAADAAFLEMSGGRVWRHGRAPRARTTPYAVWQVISATPENCLSDSPGEDRVAIQLDLYHASDDPEAGIDRLAFLARRALERFCVCTGAPINERDSESDLYRVALQFDWFWPRARTTLPAATFA